MPDPDAKRLLCYFCRLAGRPEPDQGNRSCQGAAAHMNQLAEALGVYYKAVQHHIGVLEKNDMVTKTG
jgi:DNA-binding transcriptional ArsR family regulator